MLFNLDSKRPTPLYIQLYQAIKDSLHDGHLAPNTQLPSKRQLAKQQGISLNTVLNAYAQLELEGYIYSKPRKGYYTADVQFQTPSVCQQPACTAETQPQTTWRYDLTRFDADASLFPFQAFKRTYQQVLDQADPALLSSSPIAGDWSLRQALAQYLAQARGVPCHPSQIIIGANAEALFQILLTLLPAPQRLGVEDPGYHQLVPYLNSQGWNVAAFQLSQLAQFDILAVTPNHQFPTGWVMPLEQRQRLLQWAASAPNRWIIEDDYDSEFKYAGRPVPALAHLDHHHNTIYMGSLARALSSGFRMSYMVLPEVLRHKFERQEIPLRCGVLPLTQRVLAQLMHSGQFERHLNRSRSFYKHKRDDLIHIIRQIDPAARFGDTEAGLHLLLTPSIRFDAKPVLAALAHQAIKLKTLADYQLQPTLEASQTLLISFSATPASDFEDLIQEIYTVLRRYPA